MMASSDQSNSFIPRMANKLVQKRKYFVLFSLFLLGALAAGLPKLIFEGSLDAALNDDDPMVQLYHEIRDQYSSDQNIVFLIKTKKKDLFNPQDIKSLIALHEAAEKFPYGAKTVSIINYEYIDTNAEGLIISPLFDSEAITSSDDLKVIKQKLVNDELIKNTLINSSGNVALVAIDLSLQFDPADPQQLNELDIATINIREEIEKNNPNISIYLNGTAEFLILTQKNVQTIMTTFFPITALIMFLLLFFLFRSAGLVAAILAVSFTAVIACIGAGAWIGIELNVISIITVMFTLMIAHVDTLHLSASYLKALKEGLSKDHAMSLAIQRNFKAVLITSLTTAGGFIGFNFIGIQGFADFGNFTILGVMMAFVLSFTLFPAMAIKWSNPDPERAINQEAVSAFIYKFSERNRKPIIIVFSILVIVFAPYAFKTPFNDDYSKYWSASTEIGKSTPIISKELRQDRNIEYVIDSDIENGIYDPIFLNQVDTLVTWYKEQENVSTVVAYTNILKRINQLMHSNDPQWHIVPESKELASQYALLYSFSADSQDLVNDDNSALHLTVMLDQMDDVSFIALEKKANEWFRSRYPETKIQNSGFHSLFANVGKQTVIGMQKGFVITLVFITIVMIISLGSIKYGLISLIPNLVPPLVIFGAWGLLNGQLGQHVAAAFAISLGVIIDDTTHILVKYIEGRKTGLDPRSAVNEALNNSALALIMTTLIFGLGFLVNNLGEFLPSRDQGNVLCAIFFFALIFDLFVLPALLILFDDFFTADKSEADRQDEQYDITQ